ncbi:MAG: hypothetical protein AB7L13_03015 [Acidimicrobiia bacterium]
MLATIFGKQFWGANMAFIVSVIVTVGLTALVIPVAKMRPVGKALSWGEAMVASVYAFLVMFLAYGVVPHQFLTHADNELKWRTDKLLFGPGGVLKPKALGGQFPFTLNYQHVRDILVVIIYNVFLGAQIGLWVWWQKRGQAKPARAELTTSTYGRPLVRKG